MARCILVVTRSGDGGQMVSVKDNGPGIPEDEIETVLSSFGQGSLAQKTAEQGAGLGLPIVQKIMELHQGRFDLFSKLRFGTEVIATFPRARVMDALAPVVEKKQPARDLFGSGLGPTSLPIAISTKARRRAGGRMDCRTSTARLAGRPAPPRRCGASAARRRFSAQSPAVDFEAIRPVTAV